VAQKLKDTLGNKIIWIHLIADENILVQRLKKRNLEINDEDLTKRIERATAKVNINGSDFTIDTSNLNAWEIFFQALVKI
jgi:ribose 1,5-bisphosphokinase PhnN